MLLGYNLIKHNLLTSHRNNKLHHAILLHGKKGIGKSNFAKEFVLKILNSSNLNHPNLLLIEKEEGKKEISVEKIRNISGFLNQTSAISKDKFIIIDSADELNKSSANALLKTLEEPHTNNFLILISHNPNKVIATIKSRCQLIKIADLNLNDFSEILRKNNPQISTEEIKILSHICDNSPAKALEHGEEFIKFYSNLLSSLKNNIISEEIYKNLSDKNFSLEVMAETLEFFLNRLIKFLNNSEIDFYFDEKEVFFALKEKLSLKEVFVIYDNIRNSLQKTRSLYLDKKLTFINIFNQIVA
ncbi:MAG: AAA family ATPase [Rickettsiales bacterium]|nr:AAA family ATPase [Rickettsiales bacterium]